MLAPWCPTCSSKVLLGPGRIVSIERGPDGLRAVLRCHCGTLLVWSAAADRREACGDQPSPTRISDTSPSAPTTVMVGATKLER